MLHLPKPLLSQTFLKCDTFWKVIKEISVFMEKFPIDLIYAFYYLLWEIKNNA